MKFALCFSGSLDSAKQWEFGEKNYLKICHFAKVDIYKTEVEFNS